MIGRFRKTPVVPAEAGTATSVKRHWGTRECECAFAGTTISRVGACLTP